MHEGKETKQEKAKYKKVRYVIKDISLKSSDNEVIECLWFKEISHCNYKW